MSDLSLAEIGRRIDLNRQSGWGLEKGTASQLNLLALYCHKHHLLPGDDCTLYDGRPFITIDGRVKLMNRRPEFISFRNRPLSKDEKAEWGYEPDDIVVECTIKYMKHGQVVEMQARGKVSKSERIGQGAGRLNPVAKIHPVEMAEKRAIARAERFAFGTESFVDDEALEDAVRTSIEERNDTERNAELSRKYQEIYGHEDNGQTVDIETGEVTAEP